MVPIHPGRILKGELLARELSANRLALSLRVPSGRISDILNGKRGISLGSQAIDTPGPHFIEDRLFPSHLFESRHSCRDSAPLSQAINYIPYIVRAGLLAYHKLPSVLSNSP